MSASRGRLGTQKQCANQKCLAKHETAPPRDQPTAAPGTAASDRNVYRLFVFNPSSPFFSSFRPTAPPDAAGLVSLGGGGIDNGAFVPTMASF